MLPNVSKLSLEPIALAYYLLDEAKIAVVPWGKEYIRISYVNSYNNLHKAMQDMHTALEGLQRSSLLKHVMLLPVNDIRDSAG